MIQMRTWLTVADNSGARKLMCIMPIGGDAGLKAGLGDIVTASVKEATPESQIKEGKVVKCVIVRMRKEARRKDGTYIRFDPRNRPGTKGTEAPLRTWSPTGGLRCVEATTVGLQCLVGDVAQSLGSMPGTRKWAVGHQLAVAAEMCTCRR